MPACHTLNNLLQMFQRKWPFSPVKDDRCFLGQTQPSANCSIMCFLPSFPALKNTHFSQEKTGSTSPGCASVAVQQALVLHLSYCISVNEIFLHDGLLLQLRLRFTLLTRVHTLYVWLLFTMYKMLLLHTSKFGKRKMLRKPWGWIICTLARSTFSGWTTSDKMQHLT